MAIPAINHSLLNNGWQKLRQWVRWVFVGWLFVILLTAIVAMWEVLSFQDSVRSVAGDSETKFNEVLRAVDEAALIVDGGSQSVGQLAVTLDSLRSSAAQLRAFQGLKYADEQQANKTTMTAALNRIETDVDKLITELYAKRPLTQLAASMDNIENRLNNLKNFGFKAEKVVGPLPPELNDARAALERAKTEMVNALNNIPDSRTVDPLVGITKEDLDNRRTIIAELRQQATALDELNPPLWQVTCTKNSQPGGVLSEECVIIEPQQGTEFTTDGVAKRYQDNVDNFDNSVNAIGNGLSLLKDASFIETDDKTLNDHFRALQKTSESYYQQMRPLTAAFADETAEQKGLPVPPPPAVPGSTEPDSPLAKKQAEKQEAIVQAKLSELNGQLSGAINTIRTTLQSADSNFITDQNFAQSIIKLRLAADELGRFEVADKTSFTDVENDDVIRGADAGDELISLQNYLSEQVSALQNSLLGQSRIQPVVAALREHPQAIEQAKMIMSNYDRLADLDWTTNTTLKYINISFQKVGTLGNQSLTVILVLLLGALGSLIYMTKEELKLVISRTKENVARELYPLPWYVFRPVFGAVIAFAIYLIYKTGQLALGSGVGGQLDAEVNIPILSVFSLFAGLLAWQTLEMIEGRGKSWLGGQNRRNLYATGLEQALRNAGHTAEECATQIGRSTGQIERWIANADLVTPELQDRISTWLGKPYQALFTDRTRSQQDKLRWAKELKIHVDRHPVYAGRPVLDENGKPTDTLDRSALADRLGVTPTRLNAFIEGDEAVPVNLQWQLVEILDAPLSTLFQDLQANADAWAVGLRPALETNVEVTIEDVASGLKVPPEIVRGWLELEQFVPAKHRASLARLLHTTEAQLFSGTKPAQSRFRWASNLRHAMAGRTASQLADDLLLEQDYVRDWMEADRVRGPVTPFTQRRLDQLTGHHEKIDWMRNHGDLPREALTDSERAGLAKKINDETIDTVAAALDVDPTRLLSWRDDPKPILKASAEAVRKYLKKP